MTGIRVLLDEHVGRLFERLLRERGYDVEQAKDRFGEHTDDLELLRWCADESAVLFTNNAKDFEPLHRNHEHGGILLYRDQKLPDTDPEGLARTVDEVFTQYGVTDVEGELVEVSVRSDGRDEDACRSFRNRGTARRTATDRQSSALTGCSSACACQRAA